MVSINLHFCIVWRLKPILGYSLVVLLLKCAQNLEASALGLNNSPNLLYVHTSELGKNCNLRC